MASSEQLKEQGNKYFNLQNFPDAINYYTKAIVKFYFTNYKKLNNFSTICSHIKLMKFIFIQIQLKTIFKIKNNFKIPHKSQSSKLFHHPYASLVLHKYLLFTIPQLQDQKPRCTQLLYQSSLMSLEAQTMEAGCR